MRPSSSTSDDPRKREVHGAIFGALFGSPRIDSNTDDTAWVRAMLDVESAIAAAGARAGVVPDEAAAEIARVCASVDVDIADLGRGALSSGNPVVPLVRLLTDTVGDSAAPYVHLGATSQDVLDTAMMLLARRALAVVHVDLAGVAAELATLAGRHRGALMPARTLLQQALPTTFGLKCASWLTAVDEARRALLTVDRERLAVQYGGAVGTLASLGRDGVRVMALLADELDLVEPTLPWHTDRSRVAALAATLGMTIEVLGKIGRDVSLLAQTEVGEVAEAGGGESSTMPHKNNPVNAVLLGACARRAPGLVATLLATMEQEHERAAGAWHAEWEPLTTLLRLTGAAAGHARRLLESLQVDTDRMRTNLDATDGGLLTESVAVRLAQRLGHTDARDLVRAAVQSGVGRGAGVRDALLSDPTIVGHLGPAALEHALDPAAYIGSAGSLVDRALTAHHALEGHLAR